MNLILLTQSTTPVIGQVAWVLGMIMNGIFYVIDLIGLPNIGLAIILFTIVVNLLMTPLNIKQQKFSKLQAKMSPELQAIEAKYKGRSDQDAMMAKNQEIQMIYAKYGVSATGSCVQLLIQMPILIAMFRFFPASIELREQPFLWADDLSSYDSVWNLPFSIPFYGDHVSLFALLMTVTLFVFSYFNYQQTASSQPQMAGMKFMMVYLMPIMMLFWFNNYSSGLCYYYFLSTLISIVQTLVIRRMIDDEKIHAIMKANVAKRTNGKKSKFQQRYEELMREQQARRK